MTYDGRIKNGSIVLDDPPKLPEGAKVRVSIEQVEGTADDPSVESPLKSLLKFAGIAKDLPSDFAKNHDHYIHGAPKRP